MAEAITSAQVDSHLDAVMIRQLTWKPTTMRVVALAIVSAFQRDKIQWTDHIDLAFVPEADVNCIGTAWRLLVRAGILAPMGQFKRSAKEPSKGRKVFKYRLASAGLAETFMRRNGGKPFQRGGQLALPLATAEPLA